MYKVQVNIPAAITNLGPGLHTLGLALNLTARLELMTRPDGKLKISITGEGAEHVPTDYKNPTVKAISRLFQQFEKSPPGLELKIHNAIPLRAGLNGEAALLIGGLVAANNIIEAGLSREDLIELALGLGVPPLVAMTSLVGGLNACIQAESGKLFFKSLEPPPLPLVVVVPELPDYIQKTAGLLPKQVPLAAAIHNMGRLIFMMDALVAGDLALLRETLQDRLYQAAFTAQLPGFEAAQQAALAEGAIAVTLASQGPALLAFSPYNHAAIAEAMQAAFLAAGVKTCRHWTLGIDGQGVTVSVAS